MTCGFLGKMKSAIVALSLLTASLAGISLPPANSAQIMTICKSLKSETQIISKTNACNEKLYEKIVWHLAGNSPKGTLGSKQISITTCRSKGRVGLEVIRKNCNRASETKLSWERPLGPPDAPSIISVTPNINGSAVIVVKAPSNNGGARINSYSVVQFDNKSTSSKSSTGSNFLGTSVVSYPLKSQEKIPVGGLTPGQRYRFAVVATNAAGTSQMSESSEEFVVPSTPISPTITSVVALGPGSALVSFEAFNYDSSSPITSFIITAQPGGLQSIVSSPLLRSHTFTGLSHSTSYTFTIKANSEAGPSSSSEQSPPVRTFASQPPTEPVQTSSIPSAPVSIAVPAIVLSSTSETSTTGVALAGYTITSTGGAVASYSISPSSPVGLTFNTSTGLLSGTPTVVASSTIYTITGTNASGSSTATFDLSVVLGAPVFTLSVTSESAATSNSIAGYSVNSTGGAIASYSISPSAPAGLTFNTSTGLLTGTPANVASSTTYTITGINAAGSATATFVLTVTLGAPTFSLSSGSESRTVNTAATGFTVTSTGGAVASYSISPSAPAGMSFDTSTGAFTGTPTTIAGATLYTVTATNTTGSFTRAFTFTVVVAAPAFTLSSTSESRTANTVATGFTVSSIGGAVASYSISPAAPAGMSFDTSTGAFTGTPTSIAGATVYTVTATNATGASTATFTFTVVVAIPAFTLSSSSENRTVNTAATGFTVTSIGGAVASYSISPSAPAGMSFDTSTGAFTGTPTSIAGATTYTITATNTTGSSTATFTLTVVVAAPAFTISSSSESRATGSTLAGYTITSTGGAVASYSISPSVPTGLTFSTSTGLLSGSPTSVASATTYTITATNTSGTATSTFELTVTLGAPAFSLSSTSETRSAGTALSGYSISSTGGTIASYSISPSAPAGLTFSTSTGLLSGSPTVAASATTYTITATNATGNSAAEFVLTVNVGAASKAMITTQPSGAVNGVALTSQPVIRITDSSENTVTTSTVNVVASIGSGSGGTLSGTTIVAAVNGVATFTDLVLSGTVGNFTLTFTPTSLTAATSSSFTLSAGAASKAMITTQPSGAVNGSAFTTQPVIRITDAGGNTITSSSANIVVSIASGTGTLSGTTTVSAVNGVATFINLAISGTGNYTLTFTPAGGLTAVTSSTINVTEVTCAQGGSCALGDTGPGGGKVFYYSAVGFSCGPTFASTCNYLEVAPSTWSGSADTAYRWDPTGGDDVHPNIPNNADPHLLTAEIGLGYKNSVQLFNFYGDNNDYAAGAARRYTSNGKSDWYLGSAVEMNLLCDWSKGQAATPTVSCGSGAMLQGNFRTESSDAYWTSSEGITNEYFDARKQTFTASAAAGQDHKSFQRYVRPIRSF